jgi:AraC family transcriptional regulator of adaptative response/methylated-DNA-[protein]-cysteine methyltransferase
MVKLAANELTETSDFDRKQYNSDKRRWDAVVRRDQNADGKFFYSVKTTGVYCRPTCTARQARRENVTFHATCAEAEKAGFRPCKRCQPNAPALEEQYAAKMARACRIIQSADEAPSLAALAKAVALSPFHFHRIFKRTVGVTPKAYAVANRAERMRIALPKHRSVTEAIYDAGYKSNSRFYAKSSEMLGMKPKTFRNGGDGATIHFATGKCSLGIVLVASTEKGICAIQFGDDIATLTEALRDRFPRATLMRASRDFARSLTQVISFVEKPDSAFSLPLDVRGTAFQQRVWQALREIPPGETTTYSELAASIGRRSAVRAVGAACGANPVAVVIPCHRVIGKNGDLTGYRWGVSRKRSLLQRESAASNPRAADVSRR